MKYELTEFRTETGKMVYYNPTDKTFAISVAPFQTRIEVIPPPLSIRKKWNVAIGHTKIVLTEKSTT